jgi:hypothetical protein
MEQRTAEKQTVNGKFHKEVITSGFVSKFLVKQEIPMLSHPPYSPDLAPADFFLFPKLKIVMEGTRFEAVSSI